MIEPTSNEKTVAYSYHEAEALRLKIEPMVRQMRQHYQNLREIARFLEVYRQKISLLGGYFAWNDMQSVLEMWNKHQRAIKDMMGKLSTHGVVVRDPEQGLIDIPGRLQDSPIYWCWKPDESVILFYHSVDEGFAGRKPVPPEIRNVEGTHHDVEP